MSTRHVRSADGTMLAVSDIGPRDAPAFVLIHGWAQARMAWEAQAPLAERFRLVSFDLRGHGESDAPQTAEAYTDTALWAADVRAVLEACAPRNPILVGWSYGARVLGAYLEIYGPKAVAGVAVVGGIIAMGPAREPWMAGPDSPGMHRALYSDDPDLRTAATQEFVCACSADPLDPAYTARLIAANMRVSALVRRSMFKAAVDLRPVWARFPGPALVVHGVQDTVVPPGVGEVAHAAFPASELALYEGCGHAPFLEDPARFNADLGALAARTIP